jgi:hypothetical protein
LPSIHFSGSSRKNLYDPWGRGFHIRKQDPWFMTCHLQCKSFPAFPWTKSNVHIVRWCQLWHRQYGPMLSCIFSLFDHHLHLHHHPVLVAKFRSSSLVTVLRFVKIAVLGKLHMVCFPKMTNEKHTIETACKISLPDDEHMMFETCRRHQELN